MKRSVGICVSAVLWLAANAFPDVQVVNAKKDPLKLSPEVVVAGEVVLPGDPLSIADLSKESLPQFVNCQNSPWGIALGTSKAAYIFDSACMAVLRSLPISDVRNIIHLFPEGDDYLVGHSLGGKYFNSRIDMTTGKILWSIDLDFVSGYFHTTANSLPLHKYLGSPASGPIGFYEYNIPFSVSLHENNRILLSGLTLVGTKGALESFLSLSTKETADWGNRVVFLDAATGNILQEERFDLQRNLTGSLKCFISLDRKEFRILDTREGKFTLSGKFEPGDVLAKKGFASPLDLREANREIIMNSDIHPLLTDNELLLISHARVTSAVSMPKLQASWLKYDLNGNRTGQVTPSPLSSLSFQVRNSGESDWPVVMIGMQNKYMGPGPASLIVVKKDGRISEAPWPKIKSNIFYYLFHDGQYVYIQARKGWFRSVIGEENAIPVPWEEVREAAPAELIWKFSDDNRGQEGQPKISPSIFKKYVSYRVNAHTYGSIDTSKYDQIRALRVWGSDQRKELGDIMLVPALLQDNSTILVGLSLPQNEVVFYLPMLHIKGLPQEDYKDGVSFIYGLKYFDDRRALLIVGETLNSYKVYSLTRPAMQE